MGLAHLAASTPLLIEFHGSFFENMARVIKVRIRKRGKYAHHFKGTGHDSDGNQGENGAAS
jgi:hypothetical protein